MEPALERLIQGLPPGTVSTHPGEVWTRARDLWALALLRESRGDRVPPPAAVVFPKTTEEVAVTLAWAAETGASVVPRGGGSGGSGGAQAIPRGIVLDLSRMDRILDVDRISQAVSVEAGVVGADLEEALGKEGLTLGNYVDTLAISTVGGWVATAAAGVASAGYGAVEDLVLGVTAVLAGGDVVRVKPVPRPGAGLDLRRLLTGSEGTLAVVTEATLSASRAPAGFLWEVVRPSSFESGLSLLREIVQRRFRPLVLRLLDDVEAASAFSSFGHTSGAILIVGFDLAAPAVEPERFDLLRLARDLGARTAPVELAEHWWEHRGDWLEWYRAVMEEERALGRGVVADVVDVAALWRRLPRLHEEVGGALRRRADAVACRVAHAYRSGATLSFSFFVRAADDREAEEAYAEIWSGAAEACLVAGGTLAHEQAVGLSKAPLLARELGVAEAAARSRIKAALDPQGLLNPGKVLPGPPRPEA